MLEYAVGCPQKLIDTYGQGGVRRQKTAIFRFKTEA